MNLTIRNFYTDVGQPVPTLEGYNLEPRLEGNYVYLTGKEQKIFATRELQHVVHQLQTFRFPSIIARTKLDLDAHNVMHRIVFYGRRSDAIEGRNDYINLSNWKNKGQAPYWPLSAAATVPNSGRFVPYTQYDILRSARLVIAGNEVFEEKEAKYFEAHAPFTTTEGGMYDRRFRPDEVMGPIYQLPFSLHASDHQQPSGTLNASMLREVQLEVNPWTLDPGSNYTYDFTVFVESLNLVRVPERHGWPGLRSVKSAPESGDTCEHGIHGRPLVHCYCKHSGQGSRYRASSARLCRATSTAVTQWTSIHIIRYPSSKYKYPRHRTFVYMMHELFYRSPHCSHMGGAPLSEPARTPTVSYRSLTCSGSRCSIRTAVPGLTWMSS
jgi:hypothetical protein